MSTIGKEIDTLYKKYQEYTEQNKKAKALYEEYQIMSEALRQKMTDANLEKGSGAFATVSLKESVVAHVKDWDKVYNYILRNKSFHLLTKRVADAAFREIVELRNGKPIPGTETFTKKGINLRKR